MATKRGRSSSPSSQELSEDVEACSVQVGKPSYKDLGYTDVGKAYKTCRSGLVSLLTDGGPIVHECSPGKPDYEGDALFPVLTVVRRDRAHQCRPKVTLDDDLRAHLMDLVVTGRGGGCRDFCAVGKTGPLGKTQGR